MSESCCEPAILTAHRQLGVTITIAGVVHDHARGLHQGVTNGRSDERETGFFQPATHFHGDRGHGRHLAAILEMVDGRHTANKRPEKTHRVFQRQPGLGVAPCGIEFQAVADDPGIEHQVIDFGVAHLGHALHIKAVQHLTVALALLQHSDP